MKSSPKLYNFDALYENCKETFENPKGTPLQKKSKFRKKISVVCLNVEIPTGCICLEIQPIIRQAARSVKTKEIFDNRIT